VTTTQHSKTKTKHGWTVLDETEGALMFTYSFAKGGYANAMTARLADGSLCLISPPCRVDDGVLRDLEPFGPVRTIVATNGYHHLGFPAWSKAFPEAGLFAHPNAQKRIAKQHPTLTIQSIDAASARFNKQAAVLSVPGMRTGDLWLKAGRSWYLGDHFMNLKDPKGVLGFVFRMVNSAPGFKANAVARALFTKDKKAYKNWALELLAEEGPERVVPGHGDFENGGSVAAIMRSELETRF
jgi:hypothetical protein